MDEPRSGATMVSELRDLARLRWRENAARLRRRESWRHMYAAFMLGIALVVCALLLVEIAAQHITERDRTAIEGALHGE
jgi:Tfp pilus assembly protein PilN